MLGVISNGGIGSGSIRSIFVIHRETGQIAVVPRLPAIRRGGKPDIAAPPSDAAGPACDVKGGHDHVAPCEHRRLNFSLVIAVRVGEIVDADSYRSVLRKGG